MSTEDIETEDEMHGCCERNKLSICLCVLLILVTMLLFGVFFLFIGLIEREEPECETPSFLKSSVQIKEFIDDSIEPCDDFYQFVCGNFLKTAYEKQINNPLNAERDRIKNHMNQYIIGPLSRDDPQSVKTQKAYFQACLNEDEIDEDEDKTFIKKLNEIGEWPLLRPERWQERKFDWKNVMVRARRLRLPFEWFLKVDLFYDEDYKVKLAHPSDCGVNLDEDYFEMQRDIFELLRGRTINTIFEINNLTQFQTNLNSICLNTTNLQLSMKRVANIRWDNIRTEMFLADVTGGRHRLRFNSEVALEANYIDELHHLLARTPKNVQASYILWKMIEYFAPYLSKPIRERHAEYLSTVSGEDTSRFQFCLEDTKVKFKFFSEIVDLENFDLISIQEAGEDLVSSINEEIISSIESVKWRDNKSKDAHIELYESMEQVITGADDNMFDQDFITEDLPAGELFFYSDNLIHMLLEWSESILRFKMDLIGKTETLNLDAIYEANSEYEIILNEELQQLIIPASAFQSFLFESELPQYLNYAGLGTTIATKLVEGLHLLSKSKYESYVGLEESKKCIIDHLEKSDKHLNATFLFHQNYESLLGQHFAYKAYQKYIEENEEDPELVGLPYSPNQLFWIKSSLNWCYRALPEEDDSPELENIYKYRIIEGVKNSELFASDFNCSMDASMNRQNKCRLF